MKNGEQMSFITEALGAKVTFVQCPVDSSHLTQKMRIFRTFFVANRPIVW